VSTSQQQLKCCSCGGNHTVNYRGCAKLKEAKAALAKRSPIESSTACDAPSPPNAPKAKRVKQSAEQESLVVVRGGCVVKAATAPSPNPAPGPVTESLTRNEVTTTRAKGKTVNTAPKVRVGSNQAPMTKSNKTAKPRQPSQPKSKELLNSIQPNQSPIEISSLLDNLPLNACVELTRKLLTPVPTYSPLGQLVCGLCLKSPSSL